MDMKKLLLFLFLLNCINFAFSQTTATNFNVTDCAGTNHDLFAELDAGKVVVISFVMPCGSCIGPSLSANSKVKSYATSDPDRVKFYVADDLANTSCSSLTSWVSTNGMTGVPVFSSKVVKMSDYGTAGMPKIVVIAGKDHTILFNQDNTISTTDLTDAINKGLSLVPNGIADNSVADFKLELFPNPLKADKITLNYILEENSDIIVDIYNVLGSKEQTVIFEKQTPGKHDAVLNFEGLSNGVYLVKFNAENSSKTLKLIIAH
jgi:hypothetical protein